MMIRLLTVMVCLPVTAMAEVPRVMTDIAPIHSLTAQVMGDLGAPDLLLPPGADPHDFALRPSDAARLGEAEVMIWAGHALTPWLEEPLETLAPQAKNLSLLETDGWPALEIREDVGDHDHGHEHGDEGIDPHAWLDPQVAAIWMQIIAEELASLDPDNAEIYRTNSISAITTLTAQTVGWDNQLSGLTARSYILPHDGYQYFEARFGLTADAAIAGIDARNPGPAQIAKLREQNVVCVFSDAEIGDNWANLLIEGSDARTAKIDGVGVGLTAGPALYGALLDRLARQFSECLGG